MNSHGSGTIDSEIAQSGTSSSLDLNIATLEKEQDGLEGVLINGAHICDMKHQYEGLHDFDRVSTHLAR